MNQFTTSLIAGLALGAAAMTPATAADYGTVVSSTPAYQQVSVPQQQCTEQQQWVRPAQTGAGGLIGALIGGVAGNAFGRGGGRALATGAGVIGGALLGDRVEANATPPSSVPVQQCQTVRQDVHRLVGYDVVYTYNGQTYSTRLANDPGAPGAALALNISPVAMGPAVQAAPVVVDATPQVIYSQPAVVYSQPPVVYGAPLYAAPSVGLSIGGSWGGGYRHWH